jgi:hypothetical protein
LGRGTWAAGAACGGLEALGAAGETGAGAVEARLASTLRAQDARAEAEQRTAAATRMENARYACRRGPALYFSGITCKYVPHMRVQVK